MTAWSVGQQVLIDYGDASLELLERTFVIAPRGLMMPICGNGCARWRQSAAGSTIGGCIFCFAATACW